MLPIELLFAIASFALVTCATPGPNNIMLTASGANFGFVKTLPHIAGILAGVALLHLCIGLGLGILFQQFPIVQQSLKVAGSAYLLWLAFKLLQFNYVDDGGERDAKPFSFVQALGFQYINPKAWVMVISANASFSSSGDQYWLSIFFITLTYALVGAPSIMIWAAFGQMVGRYLRKPTFLRFFNITMAALTAACVVFIWMD